MNFVSPLVLVVFGFVAVAVIIWISTRILSSESKVERRRRRNNYRVASKARRPAVTLSVKTKKS